MGPEQVGWGMEVDDAVGGEFGKIDILQPGLATNQPLPIEAG